MTQKQVSQLAAEAAEVITKLEEAKALYSRLDALTDQLNGACPKLLAKHGVQVVDNFASKNTVWKSSAVRRFELKKVSNE